MSSRANGEKQEGEEEERKKRDYTLESARGKKQRGGKKNPERIF